MTSALKQPKIIVLIVLAGLVCVVALSWLVYRAGFRQRVGPPKGGVWREGGAEGAARGGAGEGVAGDGGAGRTGLWD